MRLRVVQRPSPNVNERPAGTAVDTLVMHYTGMPDAESAMVLLTDPAREKRVSAHYTLDTDGTVYAHVPEAMRAWHAGASHWRGRDDLNSRSIGIEVQNPGHELGLIAYPPRQVDALIALSLGILSRWPIPARNVIGHSDIAPGRKVDPGEMFPWRRLARHGIGLFPEMRGEAARPEDVPLLLTRIGYGVDLEGGPDLTTVLSAFQMHWAAHRTDGVPDGRTLKALARLARRVGASPLQPFGQLSPQGQAG
jgi:N-acetylmuramoyl-L-alanine amidase